MVELVFSPSDNNWSVSVIMNEEDMKNKSQYTNLVSDRLTVREKEYQLMMESTVPATTEPGLIGGGEEQVELLKQQLKQKDEENILMLHEKDQVIMEIIQQNEEIIRSREELRQQKDEIICQKDSKIQLRDNMIHQKNERLQQNHSEILDLQSQLKRKDKETMIMLHEKDQMIMEIVQQNEEIIRNKEELQQQDNMIHLKDETICQKDDEIQLRDNVIRQKDDLLQQNEREISDLQSQLESRSGWVIQDEEVNVTNTIIGDGAYGEVRVAIFRGARVAAKLLHEVIVSRHNKRIFTREMELSSEIHHPYIVQFIGATRINNPILLYELMATSLHKRLQDDESLTHSQIVSIASDICTAMCYLHQWRPDPIIHRDISSPNVLMEPLHNDKWRAKLSDFGSANLQLHIKTVIPGNPAYAAPEALIPQHHSPAMDVYSFGVLLTEMTLHCAPEMDSTRREQRARSIRWVEMRVIVLKCINNDRSQRLSSEQLLTELQKL